LFFYFILYSWLLFFCFLNFHFYCHCFFSDVARFLFTILFLFRELFSCWFDQLIYWVHLFFQIIYFFFFHYTFLLNVIKLLSEYLIKLISFFHVICMFLIEFFASKFCTTFSTRSANIWCIIIHIFRNHWICANSNWI